MSWFRRLWSKPAAATVAFGPGSRVRLMISDPWDLVTACGAGPFPGVLRLVHRNGVVVQLEQAISYEDYEFSCFWAEVRHEGESFLADWHSGPLSCNLVTLKAGEWEADDFEGIYDFATRTLLLGSLGSVGDEEPSSFAS